MATGQRPFSGETSISILSSVLKGTPRSVTEINPALPTELGRIIRRALAKDPERLHQNAKDLRNDLQGRWRERECMGRGADADLSRELLSGFAEARYNPATAP